MSEADGRARRRGLLKTAIGASFIGDAGNDRRPTLSSPVGVARCPWPALALVLLAFIAFGAPGTAAQGTEPEWRAAFQAADAYHRMSIELEGDSLSLAKATRLADKAATLAPPEHKATVQALQRSIAIQREMAAESFQGNFPVARLLAGAAPDIPLELNDPPEWLAASTAVRTLLNDVSPGARNRTQLHAVFFAPPGHQHLEGEAAATARTVPGVLFQPRHVVAEALGHSEAALADLGQGRADRETLRRLRTALGAPDLLVGTLRVVPLEDGDAMVEARATLVRGNGGEDTRLTATGYNRDRRSLRSPTWGLTLGLGLGIVALGAIFLRRSASAGGSSATRLTAVQSCLFLALAFAAGRLLPLVLFKALGAAVPLPDAGADCASTWWWPDAAGVMLFAVPLLVWRTVSFRAAAVLREAVTHGRLGWAGAALSLGAAAYAGGILIRYWGQDAVPTALMLGVCAGAAGGLLGRCLDRFDPLPPAFGVVGIATMATLGRFLCKGELAGLEMMAALTVLNLSCQAWTVIPHARRTVQPSPTPSAPGARWANPVVDQVWNDLSQRGTDGAVWLGLSGPESCGKSTVIDQLLDRMRGGGPLTVLRGGCDAISGMTTAPTYGPFEKALAGHVRGPLANSGVDAVLDTTTTLLMAPVTSMLGSGAGEQNIHVYVTDEIERMADHGHVVLVIEGVQRIDEASRSLLAYLRRGFRCTAGRRLTVILEGRHTTAVAELFDSLDATGHALHPLDPKEQQKFLESEGLTPEAATWVIGWNAGESVRQTPRALRDVIDHLQTHKKLVADPGHGGLCLDTNVTAVPVLPGMERMVRDTLKAVPAARALLTAAACAAVNTRFDVSLVAAALGRPTAAVTELLDELWRRPHPLVEDDDGRNYRFVSQHALEAVAEELKTAPQGPRALVPARVRNIYGSLADIMRGQPRNSLAELERLVLYSYAAGPSHAELAVDALFTAAEVLMRTANQFERAKELMAQADEVGKAAPHLQNRVERGRMRIGLLESHLTNNPAVAAEQARKALTMLTDSPTDPLLPAIVQSCFDGMGTDPTLHADTLRLAERLAQSNTPHAVDGLHIQGLCHPGRSPIRRELLRRALDMARRQTNNEAESRITNSLAEALSLSAEPEDRTEAEILFKTSLELKRNLPIPDRRGEARTHGGLGRLAYFGTPRDLEKAKTHFGRDLELSVGLGDWRGESQMRSMLGACAVEEGDWDTAIAMHGRVIEMKIHPFDVFMSFAGLMQTYRALGRSAEYKQVRKGFDDAGGFGAAPEGTHAALKAALADRVAEPA